jgi:hypothetical protein
MSTLKDKIANMIHDMPENTPLEDIQYHLYVIEKVRKGQISIKNGQGISSEDAKARLAKWLTN